MVAKVTRLFPIFFYFFKRKPKNIIQILHCLHDQSIAELQGLPYSLMKDIYMQ